MPAPLLAAVGGGLIASGVSMIGKPFISPYAYMLEQCGWFLNPVQDPSVHEMMSAYAHGLLTHGQLTAFSRMAGYHFGLADVGRAPAGKGRLWNKVLELAFQYPDVRHWIDLFLRGWIKDEKALEEKLKRAGTKLEYWVDHLEALRPPLGMIDLRDLTNRGWYTPDEFDEKLERQYGYDSATRRKLQQMRQLPPGPADLVRFSVREAFNEEAAKRLGLDEEYDQNPEFKVWMEAQGQGVVECKDSNGVEHKMDAPKMYWRAHWDLPSPTQAYQMLHRLRPTGGPNGGPRDPSGLVMVAGEPAEGQLSLSDLLKAADYAPKWRGPLQAVSYLVPGRIDARKMYALGTLGKRGGMRGGQLVWDEAEKELAEVYEDMGYNEQDAKRLTLLTAQADAQQRTAPITKRAITVLRNSYAEGFMTEEQFTAALEQLGVQKDVAAAMVMELDAAAILKRGRSAIAAIRKGYLAGAITVDELDGLLARAGMPEERRTFVMNGWILELQGVRKEVSASKVVDYLVRGLLDVQEADRRLSNLGYNQGARRLMLGEAWLDVQRQIALAQQRAIKDQKERAREAMRLAREAQREAERLRKEALGAGTKEDVLRWFATGLISEVEARERLRLLKYLAADVDRLILENQGD